jgi:hypothetical protein
MTTTPEPWNFTGAQRRQFREAQAEAKRQQMERDAEAPARQEPGADRMCPGGCGCRLGTDDADRFECGCDEGCCEEETSR